MTASLVTLLLAPGLALASAEATAEADSFQFLSLDQANPLTLVDQANPQGPHFQPLSPVKPTSKSFQAQWRPNFYYSSSTFQEGQAQVVPVADNLLQYQIRINNGPQVALQQQPQVALQQQPQVIQQQEQQQLEQQKQQQELIVKQQQQQHQLQLETQQRQQQELVQQLQQQLSKQQPQPQQQQQPQEVKPQKKKTGQLQRKLAQLAQQKKEKLAQILRKQEQQQQQPASVETPRPVQRARQKASLSSSLDNSLVTRGGLFAQLSKTAKFEEAGALFKYDFHPEEKLAIMSSSLDY